LWRWKESGRRSVGIPVTFGELDGGVWSRSGT